MTNETPLGGEEVMTRDAFLGEFGKLAEEFCRRQDEVSAREQDFLEALERCRSAASAQPLSDSRLEQSHELRALIEEKTDFIRSILELWVKKMRDGERQTKFKEKLQDSLLVFVYGKVKAGKSSLGNYVAWGRHDPGKEMPEPAPGQPVFFVEHSLALTDSVSDAQIRQDRSFNVNARETTSAIQGFRLPGLTWVDSPGLHSKIEDNGALAKEYVDAADLVLYITNSGAPGKRSDHDEIGDLGRKQHNLFVIITGSDVFEEDEVDGDLVKVLTMKSRKDRVDQVNHVLTCLNSPPSGPENEQSRIVAQALARAQVFSVSARYAEEHPHPEGMSESGMGQMLHSIARLARSSGVRAKQIQPLNNLRAFLLRIREGELDQLKDSLAAAAQAVLQARSDARSNAAASCASLVIDLGPRIDALLHEHAMNNTAFRKAVADLMARWSTDLVTQATQAYASTMETTLPAALDDIAGAIPNFESRFVQNRRKRELRSRQGAAVGALLLGLAAMGVATGGATLVASGIAALVGGAAGKVVGNMVETDELITIPVGDNALEVGAATRKLLAERLREKSRIVIDSLDQSCFAGLVDWINDLQRNVGRLENETLELLADVDRRILKHDAATAATAFNDNGMENP